MPPSVEPERGRRNNWVGTSGGYPKTEQSMYKTKDSLDSRFHVQYKPRTFHQIPPATIQIIPFTSAITNPILNTSGRST